MPLKVNCWTNWITVTKCYSWRGLWRHLRLNPISGKHTLSQILGSWQTSNSSHHAAHKAQPQPVPINARWHERWNLLASSTWFPYCTGEESCPITCSRSKAGKRPDFPVPCSFNHSSLNKWENEHFSLTYLWSILPIKSLQTLKAYSSCRYDSDSTLTSLIWATVLLLFHSGIPPKKHQIKIKCFGMGQNHLIHSF